MPGNTLKYTRIHCDAAGESNSEDVPVEAAPVDLAPPARPLNLAVPLEAERAVFYMNDWINGNFTVTCDLARMDRVLIAEFLASSYWAKGIPAATVERSLAHSLCFGLLDGDRQVGFARVISDHATIAYLGDVFVLPEYRGRGLSKWLMQCVVNHPELQGLRRWVLATRDAHGLYEKFGFTPLRKPGIFMERHDPDVYDAGA